MKLTQILNKQHIGRYFEQFWLKNRKLIIKPSEADQYFLKKGIQIFKPEEILREKIEIPKFDSIEYKPKPIKFDETHPNWHERVLLSYKDHNVLVEGLTQAKVLTNTIEIKQGLPESIELKKLSKKIDEKVKNIILASLVFDGEQKKLPKIKDPARPAYNFPRVYGITQDRVNQLITSRLFNLIENLNELNIFKQRFLINNLLFSFPFEKREHLFQFQLTVDKFISSSSPLSPVSNEKGENFDHPDMFPLEPTISLTEENIYKIQTIYPIKQNTLKFHPHTIVIFYNKEEVKNLFEEEVTQQQIYGRSLLKAFTVAASYAKTKYGNNVTDLSKPITVQCVQTDGKLFHFGIFQLNTLNLENNTKNLWYQTEQIPLFESCSYESGRPTLKGYNGEVVRYLNALYNNI